MPKFTAKIKLSAVSKTEAQHWLSCIRGVTVESVKVSNARKSRTAKKWSLFYRGDLVRAGYVSKSKAERAGEWESFCSAGLYNPKDFTVARV